MAAGNQFSNLPVSSASEQALIQQHISFAQVRAVRQLETKIQLTFSIGKNNNRGSGVCARERAWQQLSIHEYMLCRLTVIALARMRCCQSECLSGSERHCVLTATQQPQSQSLSQHRAEQSREESRRRRRHNSFTIKNVGALPLLALVLALSRSRSGTCLGIYEVQTFCLRFFMFPFGCCCCCSCCYCF